MSIPVGANKTPLPPITVGTRLANRKSADSRKVVMVTGGASGIGARFATKAAAEGANVVLAGAFFAKEKWCQAAKTKDRSSGTG